ncbi:hypothetical protein PM082_007540 [Marasmius tenuissimus]|nr:hypothetical protein PM082_007540 [Marasmius tenuissimus]
MTGFSLKPRSSQHQHLIPPSEDHSPVAPESLINIASTTRSRCKAQLSSRSTIALGSSIPSNSDQCCQRSNEHNALQLKGSEYHELPCSSGKPSQFFCPGLGVTAAEGPASFVGQSGHYLRRFRLLTFETLEPHTHKSIKKITYSGALSSYCGWSLKRRSLVDWESLEGCASDRWKGIESPVQMVSLTQTSVLNGTL